MSRSARMAPQRGSRVSITAVSTETTGSPATQSSRCLSRGWSEANTSEATASATTVCAAPSRSAAATGSGAAPIARAVSTTAPHHPWVRSLTMEATRGSADRECSATSTADSCSSSRSSSPRRIVRWPRSSAASRVMPRSQRVRSSTRIRSGSSLTSWSSSWIDALDSRWASSSTRSRGWRPGTSSCVDAISSSSSSGPRSGRAWTQRAPSRPRSRSQPLAPRDLPAPIGPTSMVSELSAPRSRRSQRRGRGT